MRTYCLCDWKRRDIKIPLCLPEKFDIVSDDHGYTGKCDAFVSVRNHHFWANLVQKIKIVSLN